MTDYERGQWEGFNRVLHLLQTYDKDWVKRSHLYADVMELRPKKDTAADRLQQDVPSTQ